MKIFLLILLIIIFALWRFEHFKLLTALWFYTENSTLEISEKDIRECGNKVIAQKIADFKKHFKS